MWHQPVWAVPLGAPAGHPAGSGAQRTAAAHRRAVLRAGLHGACSTARSRAAAAAAAISGRVGHQCTHSVGPQCLGVDACHAESSHYGTTAAVPAGEAAVTPIKHSWPYAAQHFGRCGPRSELAMSGRSYANSECLFQASELLHVLAQCLRSCVGHLCRSRQG